MRKIIVSNCGHLITTTEGINASFVNFYFGMPGSQHTGSAHIQVELLARFICVSL